MEKFHSAKGTEENNYLDPILFENMIGDIYTKLQESDPRIAARHDSLKMNRDEMDYTLDRMYSMCEEIAKAADLNGDGYVGKDDAALILSHYSSRQTAANKTPADEFYSRVFSHTHLETELINATIDYRNYDDTGEFYPSFLTVRAPAIVKQREKDGQSAFAAEDQEIYVWKTEEGQQDIVDYKIDCFLPLFSLSGEYIVPEDQACENIWASKCRRLRQAIEDKIIEGNVTDDKGVIDAETASFVLGAIAEAERLDGEENYSCCLTIPQFARYILQQSYGVNLLMPRYARRVEVEDLDENFWVIGQTLTYLMNSDKKSNLEMNSKLKITRYKKTESGQIVLNSLPKIDSEYIYANPVESIEFKDVDLAEATVRDDYWAMISIRRAASVTSPKDLLPNSKETEPKKKLSIINAEMDLSNFEIVNILLFDDGFGLTAIVNGH